MVTCNGISVHQTNARLVINCSSCNSLFRHLRQALEEPTEAALLVSQLFLDVVVNGLRKVVLGSNDRIPLLQNI